MEHKEISSLVLIDLDVRYNLIEFLLNKGELTEEEISNELKLSLDTIKMNLDSLNVYEKVIFKSNELYLLTTELEGFRHLFNIIYKSDNPKLMKAFYLSKYLSEMLNHRLINYIYSRFFIENLEDKLEKQLKILISLFPEALNYCLNANTTFFQNVADFHNKSEKKQKIGDLNLLLYRFLLQNLQTGILMQYFKNQNMVHSILQEKGLMDHARYSNIVMLKGFERYLDFQVKFTVGFRKFVGKGPIKSGSFVTTTNKEQLVDEMAKLIGLKNYDGVIEETDKFLAEPSLEILKPQFLINKGVAFTYLQKNTKAIEIYEEALEFNEQLPIIYINLFRAWYNKFKLGIDNQKDYPIVPIFLIRYLNNARTNLEKFKTLELNEKDKEKFSTIINEENQFNADFNSFYEQCLKGMDVNDIPIFLALVALIDDKHLNLIYNANSDSIESLTEKEPNEISSENWNYLANFFKNMSRNDLALIAINKGLKKIEQKIDLLALSDTKGEILYNSGNYEEAFNFFNKILYVSEDDLRVRHFYAETCWKAAKTAKELGKLEMFEELRTKALKLIETHCKDEKVKKKILEEFSQ